MDRALDSLSSDFKPLAIELLGRLVERRVMVLIVQTGRTLAEQEKNVADGTSRIRLSKHLPRKLRGMITGTAEDEKADAIDVCPYETYQLFGPDKVHWADDDRPEAAAAFAAVGEVGELLGLRWGGRWHDPHDPGHLELVFPGGM